MKFKELIFLGLFVFLTISCKKSIDIDLGNKYRLMTDQNHEVFIVYGNNQPYTQVIDGQILNYAFDSTFVVVAQRPRDSVPRANKNKKGSPWIFDKEFENSTFQQYWIINKKEERVYSYDSITTSALYSNVYGPFKKKDYLQKRKELGVPKELILKKVTY